MIFIKLYLFENVRLCDLKLVFDDLNKIDKGVDHLDVSDFTYCKRFFQERYKRLKIL